MNAVPFISKSKYLSGLQCSKLLWHQYNAKDKIPPPDAALEAIFEQGHAVGALAKQLYPDGIEINWDDGFDSGLKPSLELLSFRRPLFEAGFVYKNSYARADILVPAPEGKWDIIEVKSTTKVKDVNYHDLALQRYCYEGAGARINRCYLMHLNNQYVRHGAVYPAQLFTKADVADLVDQASQGIEQRLDDMVGIVRSQKCPDVPIGLQCSNPYDCPLIDMCWSFLPEDSPLSLYRVNKAKAFELVHSGVLDIRDIPSSFTLTRAQQIQRTALLTGQPQVDTARVEEFLRNVVYPLYFMDFETFATAVPMFDNSRPFTQIPFQFSIHFLDSPGATPRNEGYLAEGTADPRPEFMRRLKECLRDRGSIVVYNQSFEKSRLSECAQFLPEYADWVNSIIPRIVDLMALFQSFQYYHPAQHGSASIKAVLPALTGKGYEDMEIAEGGTASREFMRVTYGDVSKDERDRVRKALIEYCGRDTEAMVEVVDRIAGLHHSKE